MNEAISVTKFNTYIKSIFDAEELLHNISIVGEVFGVSCSRNVIYFSLKDDNASLSCVCFYPNFISNIVEGDQVVITGSPNYYVKGGKLSFNVVRVEKVGKGKLYEEFLLLKEKLELEGLFDKSHKKSIPQEIKRIGVITSREGAVIQDIKTVSWRRNPTVDIVLYNTKVQGLNAENEIAHAIDVMGKYDNIDVIIVARGGGSLEDLWAYNTEIVARATYNCPKPIVSAVGHETDFTIIDFVSDLRAPTPSAAAELLTYNLQEKRAGLVELKESLIKSASSYIGQIKQNTSNIVYKLENLINKVVFEENVKIEKNKTALLRQFEGLLEQKSYEIGLLENSLIKANPTELLNRGYAKIEQNDFSIKQASEVDYNQPLKVIFKDGAIVANPIKE